MQSFFTGLGTTLANFAPAIIVSFGILSLSDKMDNGIPTFTYWAFGIGAFASIATILFSVLTTKEYPPTEEELIEMKAAKAEGNVFTRTIKDIKVAVIEMPKTMKQLIPVQFLTWFGMFCYWQYITLALSQSIFGTTDAETDFFAQAQILTGNINGTYNIVCFSVAFLLVPLATKIGAKKVHFIGLLLGGVSLLALPYLDYNTQLFSFSNPFGDGIVEVSQIYLVSFGLGIAWASMLAIPYKLLASSLPAGKTGVYMGIFNMFIVIPMIIQIFSMQYFLYDLLGSNPVNIITLAGVCLALAAVFTLFIKSHRVKELY
jgi:maltose/moltooligosaccharide transporter